jgi:hypothetical protein
MFPRTVRSLGAALLALAALAGAGERASAGVPLDIVIAVDSSPSMGGEIAQLQSNFNTFATSLAAGGVDARFILLAASGSVCIPAPVGSGSCPADTKAPGYQHVNVTIGSTNALSRIIANYATWSPFLRPGARRAFMVVTDDNSASSAASFDAQLLALDASFAGYRFYGFVGTAACPGGSIDAVGAVYLALAQQTGGDTFPVCGADWSADVVQLAAAVSADTVPPPSAQVPLPSWAPGLLALALGAALVRFTPRR